MKGCEKGKFDIKSTFQNRYGQKDSAVFKGGIGKFLSVSCSIREGILRDKSSEISASSSPMIKIASSREDSKVGSRRKNKKCWTHESSENRTKSYKNTDDKTLKKVDRSRSPVKCTKLEYETASNNQFLSRLTRAKDRNEIKMNHSDSTDPSLYETFNLTERINTRNRSKSRYEETSISFSNECNSEKGKGGFQSQFSEKRNLSKIENGEVESESSRKVSNVDQDIEKLPCGESGKWKYIRMYQERARRREARRRRQREKEREESGGKSRRRRSTKRSKSRRRRRSSSSRGRKSKKRSARRTRRKSTKTSRRRRKSTKTSRRRRKSTKSGGRSKSKRKTSGSRRKSSRRSSRQ